MLLERLSTLLPRMPKEFLEGSEELLELLEAPSFREEAAASEGAEASEDPAPSEDEAPLLSEEAAESDDIVPMEEAELSEDTAPEVTAPVDVPSSASEALAGLVRADLL